MSAAEKVTTTPVQYALRYARLGWPVFPCRENDKRPLVEKGLHAATTDEAMIQQLWRDNPRANIGVPAGAHFWVLDIDPRHGGIEALQNLEGENGELPDTLRSVTPSGGVHYYFAPDERARNSASKVGPGIDVRGHGGYVCVEGSNVNGRGYAFQDWDPLLDVAPELPVAPKWLLDRAFGKPAPDKGRPPPPAGAIVEGGRNDFLSREAGKLRRIGTAQSALEAALHAINQERCRPPLSEREVANIARSIARYDPERDEFHTVRSANAVMGLDLGPASYCVEGRVPCGLVIIGGRPKARKSWYALQLAIAKAAGGQFMRVPTSACRVLYVALEDNDRRMRQRLEFFGMRPESAPANLHLVYEWPNGLDGAEKLNRWLDAYPDTKLIIIDVLQRFRGPRDPKVSAYDSDYQAMAMLHGIAQRHDKLTVLVVHHVRKGAVEDPVEALNGTFAIAGAADAYIILRRGAEKDQWIAHIDGRDWASWEHDFAWEFVNQEGWRQISVADDAHLTEAQKEILNYAKSAPGYLTPTMLANHKGIAKPSAHEALMTLVSKGAMRVYAGRYYPNNP